MKTFMVLLLILLAFAPSSKAQDFTHGVAFGGEYQGFGYNPGAEFGGGVELQRRDFGLQTYGMISLSPKLETGNGDTLEGQVRPILWVRKSLGIAGDVKYSTLVTSLFRKSAVTAGGGLVLHTNYDFDVYLEYFQQFQPKLASSGIEANYLKGAEVSLDLNFYRWLRVRETIQYGHGYDQGNPQCDGTLGPDTCGSRQAWWTGSLENQIMFIF